MTVIGRDAEADEHEAENDVDRRVIDRLLVFFSRRPAHAPPARAKEDSAAGVGVPAGPDRPPISEEEAREEQEAAHQVVPEGDRPRQRGAEQQPEQDRHDQRPHTDHADQQNEPAQGRKPHYETAEVSAGGPAAPGFLKSSAARGQRSSG